MVELRHIRSNEKDLPHLIVLSVFTVPNKLQNSIDLFSRQNEQQAEKELKEQLAKQHSLVDSAQAKLEEYNNKFKQVTEEKIKEKDQKSKDLQEANEKMRLQKQQELVSVILSVHKLLRAHVFVCFWYTVHVSSPHAAGGHYLCTNCYQTVLGNLLNLQPNTRGTTTHASI